MNTSNKTDVHTTHCCKYHGCKYYDYSCTVFHGGKEQEYDCEECIEEPDRAKGYLYFVYKYYNRLEEQNKLPIEYRNIYNELLVLKLRL
jgi:hypothetical protein